MKDTNSACPPKLTSSGHPTIDPLFQSVRCRVSRAQYLEPLNMSIRK